MKALANTTFASPTSANKAVFFGRTPFSPPSPKALPSASSHIPEKKATSLSQVPVRGCTLNIQESDVWPFSHCPFVFQFEGESYVSWTVELPNAAGEIELEVLKNQREALLSFVIHDKMMRQQAIVFEKKVKGGTVLYEAVEKWRMEGRSHDKDKWKAQIKILLPIKVEFETCNHLPFTVNHQIVKRKVKNGFLKTIPFFFRLWDAVV